MKTISLPQNKYLIFPFLVILSVLVVSCGSYQNTSYYDTDGIYGNSDSRTTVATTSEVAVDNNQYKNYFGSLQDPNVKKDSTFTDVILHGAVILEQQSLTFMITAGDGIIGDGIITGTGTSVGDGTRGME
jgi:hypothetical protein